MTSVTIRTVDEAYSSPGASAVRDDLFIFVGSLGEAMALRGSGIHRKERQSNRR